MGRREDGGVTTLSFATSPTVSLILPEKRVMAGAVLDHRLNCTARTEQRLAVKRRYMRLLAGLLLGACLAAANTIDREDNACKDL